MEKTCEMCETYRRVRREQKTSHPCHPYNHLKDEICEDFKITYTQDVCLKKYPRLIAHLICHSLGYFSPLAAANAISFYKVGEAFCCEWYSHMAQFDKENPFKDLFHKPSVIRAGETAVKRAFEDRHSHHGYMMEYKRAIALVCAELKNRGCTSQMLASWF